MLRGIIHFQASYTMPTDQNARRRTFAQNIVAARIKADLTQAQLAKKANMSQSFISYVEGGQRTISIENAETLSEVLGVPLCKLLHSSEK